MTCARRTRIRCWRGVALCSG